MLTSASWSEKGLHCRSSVSLSLDTLITAGGTGGPLSPSFSSSKSISWNVFSHVKMSSSCSILRRYIYSNNNNAKLTTCLALPPSITYLFQDYDDFRRNCIFFLTIPITVNTSSQRHLPIHLSSDKQGRCKAYSSRKGRTHVRCALKNVTHEIEMDIQQTDYDFDTYLRRRANQIYNTLSQYQEPLRYV